MSDWGNASIGGRKGASDSESDQGSLRPILAGFRTQGRVLHALLIREMNTRYGRDQIGFLWMFFEPSILALAIGAVHYFRDTPTHGVPPFMLGVIGYAPFFAFRALVNTAVSALHSNTTLLYHRQIRLFDIMVARTLLQSALCIFILTVVIGAAAWITGMVPHSLPDLVGGLLLMLLLSNGLAMLVAASTAVSHATEHIVHPFTYLIIPFSGAFGPLHDLPPQLRDAMLWNPQPHVHELMRYGMFGDLIPSYYDLSYVFAWTLALNLLGMFALSAARPKLEG